MLENNCVRELNNQKNLFIEKKTIKNKKKGTSCYKSTR